MQLSFPSKDAAQLFMAAMKTMGVTQAAMTPVLRGERGFFLKSADNSQIKILTSITV